MRGDLNYRIDEFDARGNLVEQHAMLSRWEFANAAFAMVARHYPDRIIVWRQGARVVRESKPDEG